MSITCRFLITFSRVVVAPFVVILAGVSALAQTALPTDVGNTLLVTKSVSLDPDLSWTGVSDATSYDVRRCEPALPARSCVPLTIANAPSSPSTDGGAAGITFAWYLIASRNPCGTTPADPSGPPASCGNNAIDPCEECDDGNLTSGDGCSANCTNEGVPSCGDGILQAGESCDRGTSNSDTAQGACRTTCVPAGCGDSVVDYVLGERCDDGNGTAGDGCDAVCQVEATRSCGDGVLDPALGEQCDDGNTSPGDGCSPACQFEPVGQLCGNNNPDPLEVCDDGNTLNGDTCNPTCNLGNTTTLFAGSPGQTGFVDGIGTAARFGGTATMTVDVQYIWMADSANSAIRRIEIATADVLTVAGGTQGYLDDPVGTSAQFAGIESLATDGRTLWIGDGGNHRIRAMSTTPPYAVTTVAGSGATAHTDGNGTAAEFDGMRGLTYHGGRVFLVDSVAATLRRFDPATGDVVTLAGTPYSPGYQDGYGAGALFQSPRFLASDNSGMLYIADTNGAAIRSYNTVTTYVDTYAGSGTAGYVDGIGTAAQIHRPRGMTSDGTSLYWVEFNQHTVRQGVLATASVTTLVGTHCGGTAPCNGGYQEGIGTAALFNNPYSLAFHYPSNSLFVFDGGNRVLRRIQ